jgi:hypothetical protein
VLVEAGSTLTAGEFAFANPGDTAIEWRELVGSCACSHMTVQVGDRLYRVKTKPKEMVQLVQAADGEQAMPVTAIPVGPRESGTVGIHVHTAALTAKKIVTVDIHTTDPQTPMVRLQLTVQGRPAIVVEPETVDLQSVAPGSRREFTVIVTSTAKEDFEILDADPFPPDLSATWEKTAANGAGVWTIHGVYEPKKLGTIGGDVKDVKGASIKGSGLLRFHTNLASAKSFTVVVHAKVESPIEVIPGFVSFGAIHPGTKEVRDVRFQPNDGTDLEAVSIRLEKLNLPAEFVATRSHKDGAALVVEVEVADNAPKGLVRGDLVVELNHPGVGPQRILFNGFVR